MAAGAVALAAAGPGGAIRRGRLAPDAWRLPVGRRAPRGERGRRARQGLLADGRCLRRRWATVVAWQAGTPSLRALVSALDRERSAGPPRSRPHFRAGAGRSTTQRAGGSS